MQKILNKRLQTLSAFINNNDIVLDIGCDHGLLGIYLVLNYNNMKVISSDINEKPLAKAKENLLKFKLEDKIELRLGNGLDTMSNDINTIVISGMGTDNIINILKNINDYPNVKKMIISPNNDFETSRSEIRKLGFYINKEEMVLENGKYYLISEYRKGKKKVNTYFGKLDLEDAVVKNYYQYVYNNNLKILNELKVNNQERRSELLKENNFIERKIFRKINNI